MTSRCLPLPKLHSTAFRRAAPSKKPGVEVSRGAVRCVYGTQIQNQIEGRGSGGTSVPLRFALEPSAGGGVLQALADSRFHPQEWVVRADATHGKSKTYRRADVFTNDLAT